MGDVKKLRNVSTPDGFISISSPIYAGIVAEAAQSAGRPLIPDEILSEVAACISRHYRRKTNHHPTWNT